MWSVDRLFILFSIVFVVVTPPCWFGLGYWARSKKSN